MLDCVAALECHRVFIPRIIMDIGFGDGGFLERFMGELFDFFYLANGGLRDEGG